MTKEDFLKECAASECLTEARKYINETGKDIFCMNDFIEVYRRADMINDVNRLKNQGISRRDLKKRGKTKPFDEEN